MKYFTVQLTLPADQNAFGLAESMLKELVHDTCVQLERAAEGVRSGMKLGPQDDGLEAESIDDLSVLFQVLKEARASLIQLKTNAVQAQNTEGMDDE